MSLMMDGKWRGNAARAADWVLQSDFPVGCAVWQRWGSMGWRPAIVAAHQGPWIITTLEDGYPYKGRTYARWHLLRRRYAAAPPSDRPTAATSREYTMIPNLKTAVAVVDAGGDLVRFCETEEEATELARSYVENDGRTYYLFRPFKELSTAKPPIRERLIAKVRSR